MHTSLIVLDPQQKFSLLLWRDRIHNGRHVSSQAFQICINFFLQLVQDLQTAGQGSTLFSDCRPRVEQFQFLFGSEFHRVAQHIPDSTAERFLVLFFVVERIVLMQTRANRKAGIRQSTFFRMRLHLEDLKKETQKTCVPYVPAFFSQPTVNLFPLSK